MTNISSSDAFVILEKWRDGTSQVRLSMRNADGSVDGTPVSIISTSDSDESVLVEMLLSGQGEKCCLDFRDASFSQGDPSDSAVFPEFAEGRWVSYLVVEFPTGAMFAFAERLSWIVE